MKSGAATKITMARVWLVMLVWSVGSLGIASGQACPRTFFSALVQLMPCRLAVASFNPAPPSEACCNAVKTLGQPCLCALVNGPPVTGVDRYMAMQLPVKCAVNFEPYNVSLLLDSDVSQKTLPTSNIVDVIHSPITRMRLILTVAINLLSSIVYYGLSLNVGNLSTEIYVSVILNAIAEVPAYALTAMCLKWSGRRPLTIGTMWLSGVFCAVGSLLPDVRVWGAVRTACSVVGIFSMAATFDLLFIYTAELFPTAVRSAALGCVTQAGQTGAIAAPLVVVLGGNWPFAVFGACGVVGGVLGFYLPDRPFYDTMAGLVSGEMGMGAEDGYGYFVS